MEQPRLVLSFCLVLVLATASVHGAVTPMVRRMPVSPNATVQPSPLILGGTASSPGFIPYQAALYVDGASFCGGSLISDSYVLTAGHCVHGGSHWIIYLGSVHLSSSESGRQIAQSVDATLHQGFEPTTLANDVALLHLRAPVQLTQSVQPVVLATAASGDFTFLPARVSGWGLTSDYGTVISEVLYYTDLTVITNRDCAATYGPVIQDGTLCAKGNGYTNPCSGDSGGPLVAAFNDKELQVGVTSFVASASCSGFPSGYARVSYFRDWITSFSGV